MGTANRIEQIIISANFAIRVRLCLFFLPERADELFPWLQNFHARCSQPTSHETPLKDIQLGWIRCKMCGGTIFIESGIPQLPNSRKPPERIGITALNRVPMRRH